MISLKLLNDFIAFDFQTPPSHQPKSEFMVKTEASPDPQANWTSKKLFMEEVSTVVFELSNTTREHQLEKGIVLSDLSRVFIMFSTYLRIT